MKHFKQLSPALVIVIAILSKILIFGADLASSLAFSASCGLYAYYVFLKEKRMSKIHEAKMKKLESEMIQIKDYVSSLRLEKGFKRNP